MNPISQSNTKVTISCKTDAISQNERHNCFNKFHKSLSKMFHQLGYSIAKYPYYFIIIPFCIALVCSAGLSTINFIRDFDYLYTPTNAQSWSERNITGTLFPVNYSHGFDPSRLIKISASARLLISATDNQSMFRSHVWKSVMEVDRTIKNLNISLGASVYNYQDICAMFDGECLENDILKLDDIMSGIEDGTEAVNYPIMLFPLVLPFYYGEIDVNETEGVVTSAKSLSLGYFFKEGNAEEKERSVLFEIKILQILKEIDFENISIAYITSGSLNEELYRMAFSVIPYAVPTAAIIFTLTFICLYETDWVRNKFLIGVMGIVTTGLATSCSFGFLMFCQVPFASLNLIVPFLLLGIGLDDMFVLISHWKRTDFTSDVPTRMANTFSDAAFSITITSLTNCVAFLLGATSPFPSTTLFCLYSGFSILVTYIFYITFFGGCMALAGRMEEEQRHAITFQVVKAKSEMEDSITWPSIWCTGGINRSDPFNPKDNKPHIVMSFFKTHIANVLKSPISKALVLTLFLVYIIGAIYCNLHMEEGLEYKNMVLEDSYLNKYYSVESTQFKKFPTRIQVVIYESITYSNPQVKTQLLDLHFKFESLPNIGPSLYTESWIRRFYNFIERRPDLREKITDEVSFIKVLKELFITPKARDSLDVVISEDGTQILASRFIIQGYEVWTSNEERNLMTSVRKVARDAPFDVISYNANFLFWDHFLQIRHIIIQGIGIVTAAMIVISLIFIPNPLCSLWVTFSILSITAGVMGYASLWGIKLDAISAMNLVMCVGFSVDFSAHISYAYLASKANSPNERIEECLHNLGLPVIQSGVTTIGAIAMFIFSSDYMKLTFVKMVFLVVLFGTLHALFLLPVLLSLLGPDTCKNKSTFQNRSEEDFINAVGYDRKKMTWRPNKVHASNVENGTSENVINYRT